MSVKNGGYVTCIICNKKFYVRSRRQTTAKWCSKECWAKRKPPIKINCPICEKEIITHDLSKKFCSNKCRNIAMLGKKLSQDTRLKMSKSKQGYMPVNVFQKGELHPQWKKDRSLIKITDTPEYTEFRLKIFRKDNWTCQVCGQRGKAGMRMRLELHHIKAKKDYPDLFWEINNCQTLCSDCHKKTDSYLNRWGKKAVKVK